MFRYLIFLFILSWFVWGELYVPDLLDKTSGINHIGAGFTGVADCFDLTAPYWNPAGLALVSKESVGFNFYTRLQSINHASIDSIIEFKPNQRLALNFVQEEIPDIPKTVDVGGEGQKIGTFSDVSRYYNLSLSQKLSPGLYLGENFKIITHSIDKNNSTGYGLDVGIISILDNRSRVGLNFKNLVSNIGWDTGNNDHLEKKVLFGFSNEGALAGKTVVINVDYDFYLNDNTLNTWFLGGEYWLLEKQLALRGGATGYGDVTLGLGFKYYDLTADLAYIIKKEYFENALLFALSFDFRFKPKSIVKEISATTSANREEALAGTANVAVFLQTAKLRESGEIELQLLNQTKITKLAIVYPDKHVEYFDPEKFVTGTIVVPGGKHGEYTIFFQADKEEIFKQRISL